MLGLQSQSRGERCFDDDGVLVGFGLGLLAFAAKVGGSVLAL